MLSYDVVQWGQRLKKVERETPEPKGSEILLKLKYCGVCHSDVHIREGYFDLGGGQRLLMSERGMKLPLTLGHEPYGTVVAVGADAGNVPIGTERLVYPWTGCGLCARCRDGLDNFCIAPRCLGLHRPGGYADYLLVPHPKYLIDAGGIDPAWAATLACSGLATYSALSKLKPIAREEWIVLIGAGGLGLSAVGILRAMGHDRIVAVDIDDPKLELAKEAGAAATVNSREPSAAQRIKEITDGPVYGAVDFVGTTETTSFSLGLLRKGGRLILVGLYGGEIALSPVTAIQRALMIQGSHLGSLDELKRVVMLAREGKVRPIPIQKRSLSEVDRTLDELKARAVVGRIVVEA
jgi:D-arabinose 1-dehydrogenase-like Zn-dependent alcohol dehydrogenase